MKKNIIKLGAVCVFGIFLEFAVFNLDYLVSKIDKTKEYNINYTQDDMLKIHWQEKAEELVSESDPQLIVESVNTKVDKVAVRYSASDQIENILLFYSNKENPEIDGELLVVNSNVGSNGATIRVGDYVQNLRIDIGENAGIIFKDVTFVINPVEFQFSMSRIIAIILIYVVGAGLFSLQNPPDYGLNEEIAEETQIIV